jgi:cyclopropane-fatty-acyl-phospholipid synthase
MNTDILNPQQGPFEHGLRRHDAASHAADMPPQAGFMLRLLRRIGHGALRLEMPGGATAIFGDGSHPVTLSLKNWKLFGAALKSGDIGFAESHIAGDWSTDDLPRLIALFIRNRDAVEAAIYGNWWGNLLYRCRHLFNRNSRAGSRKNIHAHYDIGNAFYRLWLDPSMTYSSALFSGAPDQSLEDAQEAKYRRLLGELRAGPGDDILEIGCGWGGFAEVAACEAGARVTGLTLSTEQLEFARRRLALAGLADRADLRLQDYRDIDGRFDAIASIEMFEAVGEAYWPDYFDCIARSLKTGGRACIQSIVIADPLFARYRKGTDFIQQYIFPGGMLPSPSAFRQAAQRGGLKVVGELAFGADYARTLSEWRRAFREALPQVRQQGFDERFLRTWDFYLAYCEAGFLAGSVDVMQFTLEKN